MLERCKVAVGKLNPDAETDLKKLSQKDQHEVRMAIDMDAPDWQLAEVCEVCDSTQWTKSEWRSSLVDVLTDLCKPGEQVPFDLCKPGEQFPYDDIQHECTQCKNVRPWMHSKSQTSYRGEAPMTRFLTSLEEAPIYPICYTGWQQYSRGEW